MTALLSSETNQTLSRRTPLQPLQTEDSLLTQSQLLQITNASLETHIGSVLILTHENKVLYATESLHSRLQELTKAGEEGPLVTQEITLICQLLKQCRKNFPNQNWAIEFDILTQDARTLHIRSRWLKLEGIAKPCILLIVEDRQRLVHEMALREAQEWGLTEREGQVWRLYRESYTYRQIAEKLYITFNTVKKHMRSVHAKRRAQLGPDDE